MEARLYQIKASAGSGKTHTLTREYIKNLVNCVNTSAPGIACKSASGQGLANEILAITFTNAAASEMRERVINVLKEKALGIEETEKDPNYPSISQEEAAKWINWLLHDLNALNIRTIDSLMHLIVRSAALEHGLAPDFEPVIKPEDALEPWLKHYLDLARDNEAERKKLADTLTAIIEYSGASGFLCGQKLSWRLQNILEDTLTHKLAEVSPVEKIALSLDSFESIKKEIAESIKLLIAQADKNKLKINGNILPVLERHASGVFDDKRPKCMQYSSVSKILNKCKEIAPELEHTYQNMVDKSDQFYNYYPIFKSAFIYRHLMDFIKEIVDAFIRDRVADYKLPNFLVPNFALHTLDSGNGVPEALCRLGTRLTHFEIDEFQDTSRAQWRVLKHLVVEALARGGSMTWVGDVKQSIYVFRDAEPALFDEVKQDNELLAIVPNPESGSLDTNRRSKKNIVSHVNRIFGVFCDSINNKEYTEDNIPGEIVGIAAKILPASSPENELIKGAQQISHIYANVRQNFRADAAGGYVQCDCLPDNDEQKAEYVVKLVSNMKTPAGERRRYGDICILVRENSQAALLAEALLAEGIPIVTENSLLLKEHPLIIQLLAFLAFMRDPNDNIAFWTVLLGDIFIEHPLIASQIDREKLVSVALEGKEAFTYEQFKERFPNIWENILKPFTDGSRIANAYDAIMEWSRFMNLEKRFLRDKTYIRRFMEVVLRAGNAGESSPASFLEYWEDEGNEEKTPMPKSMNAVRIMTIHKAKGLQAPVIILPWTNFSIKASDTPVVIEALGARVPARISPMTDKDGYYPHMLKQAVEALNLFYVAITRPEEELYLVLDEKPAEEIKKSEAKESGKTIYLSPFLHAMYEKAGFAPPFRIDDDYINDNLKTSSTPHEKEEKPASHRLDSRTSEREVLPGENMGITKSGDWFDLKIYRSHPESLEMTASERGTFLHFCLQYMRIGQNPALDAARALEYGLAHSTVPVPDSENVHKSLLESLEWFAGLENARRWLETGWREQPMSDEDGNILKADLIVPEEDGVLVIDYKSGENYAEHLPQLQGYMECLARTGIFTSSPRGLLIYLDQKKILPVWSG